MANVKEVRCCKNTEPVFFFAGLLEAWLLIGVKDGRPCAITLSATLDGGVGRTCPALDRGVGRTCPVLDGGVGRTCPALDGGVGRTCPALDGGVGRTCPVMLNWPHGYRTHFAVEKDSPKRHPVRTKWETGFKRFSFYNI
jgi:hypothetical protein